MSKKNKMLIVLESIDINHSSGAKGRVALIKNLAKLGYNLKVLHYTRREVSIPEVRCIPIKELKYNHFYILSRTRRLLLRYLKIDLFKNIEAWLGFSFTFFNDSNSIAKSIKKYYENEDLIMTLSFAASFRPHHAMLKFPDLYHKWAAYIHDPYPFHCCPEPYNWFEPGYQQKEAFFKKVSKSAKYSIFPSLLLKEWMGKYFPNFLVTGIVIPHQNLELQVEDNINVPAYLIKGKFNLVYAGNLMKPRPPSGLVEGYKDFLKQYPEAKKNTTLILLGNASYYKEYLVNEQKSCSNLYCSYSYVPYSEVNYVQHEATINIILESKSEISPFLPGKFPHCVTANKPILVLGPLKSEIRRLLGDDYEYVAEVDDNNKIKENIQLLYKSWLKSKLLKLDRNDLVEYLSLTYLEEEINKIISKNG